MTQFNQELITKARKGEIAILNDGKRDETNALLREIWPDDYVASENALATYKIFEAKTPNSNEWQFLFGTNLPAHSVKDFFMNTKDEIPRNYMDDVTVVNPDQPRTYRVTRQQMKEIWEAAAYETKNRIPILTEKWFPIFQNDAILDDGCILKLRECFNQEQPEVLIKHFPSYFYIPEGEPVLYKTDLREVWQIGISAGNGKVYDKGFIKNHVAITPMTIIPFTKNPPK